MTTPSKSNGTPSKQRRTPAKQTPGSTQRTRKKVFYFYSLIFIGFYLAAKKRNPLTALQEDEPAASPAPSSVQMPFTPGRTPNKNRGFIKIIFIRLYSKIYHLRNAIFTNDIYNITCT